MNRFMRQSMLTAIALVGGIVLAQAQPNEDHGGHRHAGQDRGRDRGQDAPVQATPGPKADIKSGNMVEMAPMMAGRDALGIPFDHIEGRIAYLKAEVAITEAQTMVWGGFADAMRANAADMKTLQDRMTEGGMPITLPDRLAAQQKMLSVRIAMLERLELASRPLYAALSPEQRKLIDQAMASPMGM